MVFAVFFVVFFFTEMKQRQIEGYEDQYISYLLTIFFYENIHVS